MGIRFSIRCVRLGVIGALAIMVLSLASCSAEHLPAWRFPRYDANRSDVFPAAWNASWHPHRIIKTPIPAGLGPHPTLLFGDILGASTNEIVLYGDNHLLIYSVGGHLERKVVLSGYHRIAGFLYDEDHDGKLDIVFGSQGAARPTLSVLDGTGRVIYAHSIRDNRDYQRFIPWLNVEGQFYFVAQESWPESPRGIIRFSPPENRETWSFSVPSEPLGILETVRNGKTVSLLISQRATDQGAYPYLGKAAKATSGFDAALHLLRIDVKGNILSDGVIRSNGHALTGEGRFLPLSKAASSPLLLRRDFVPRHRTARSVPVAATETALYILNPSTGRVTATRSFAGERVLGLRLLPGRTISATRILVLVRTAGGVRLQLYSDRLKEVAARPVAGKSAVLGAVLAPPSGARPHFFLLAGHRLLLYNEQLDPVKLLTDAAPNQMIVSIASDGRHGRLILVGKDLEVYSLG